MATNRLFPQIDEIPIQQPLEFRPRSAGTNLVPLGCDLDRDHDITLNLDDLTRHTIGYRFAPSNLRLEIAAICHHESSALAKRDGNFTW
jgi:hypothetical protein